MQEQGRLRAAPPRGFAGLNGPDFPGSAMPDRLGRRAPAEPSLAGIDV